MNRYTLIRMRRRALRAIIVGLACLAAPLAFSPGAALAAPPVFASIIVTGGQATVKWSLPACVHTILVETATDKTTDHYGYFLEPNRYSFDTPRATETSLAITDTKDVKPGNFPPGTYYVHVGGQDESRPLPVLPEFSEAVQFTVDASGNAAVTLGSQFPAPPCSAGSGGGGGGGGGKTGKGDIIKVAPFGVLKYAGIQSIRKLFVTAYTAKTEKLKAGGSIRIPGKLFKFKTVSKKVRAGGNAKLRLRLSNKDLRQVLRAIRQAKKKGKQLKAHVTVTARNSAGAARSQSVSIRLKP